jgi:uncharacterized protein YjbK
MKAEREVELKFKIASREDFLDLRDSPRWGSRGSEERQVNHYFDTVDLLLVKSGAMLRIREEGDCTLTLKCGREVSPGLFDSREIESPVGLKILKAAVEEPRSLLELALDPIRELEARFGLPPLVFVGALVNERVRREHCGFHLDVDRLVFPDRSEEYELEIETHEPDRVMEWVSQLGLWLEPQRLTKLERLLRWYSLRRGPASDEEGIQTCECS